MAATSPPRPGSRIRVRLASDGTAFGPSGAWGTPARFGIDGSDRDGCAPDRFPGGRRRVIPGERSPLSVGRRAASRAATSAGCGLGPPPTPRRARCTDRRSRPLWSTTPSRSNGASPSIPPGRGHCADGAARRRGWQRTDHVTFVPGRGGRVDLRITLASSRVVDRLCAPLRTRGSLSCWNRGRAVINAKRWLLGAPTYGNDVAGYRTYLVGHEVGHGLGYPHASCPGSGQHEQGHARGRATSRAPHRRRVAATGHGAGHPSDSTS